MNVFRSLGFPPFSPPGSRFLLLKKENAGSPWAVRQPGGRCLQPGLCGLRCPLTGCNSGQEFISSLSIPRCRQPCRQRWASRSRQPRAGAEGWQTPVLRLCPASPMPGP